MVSHSITPQSLNIIIKINGNVVKKVDEAKFLGILIDNKIKWKLDFHFITTKVSKLTGVIYRIKKQLNLNNLTLI